MSKFIALFLIFSFIKFSKTQDLITSSTEQLKAFIDCINKTESFPSNLKGKILTAWTNEDGSIYRVIGELLLTQNQYIQKCLSTNENKVNNTKTIYNGSLINITSTEGGKITITNNGDWTTQCYIVIIADDLESNYKYDI